jgi:site-specific DNA-adenine methylase
MTNEETIELLTGACRAYDRLAIVMEQVMEYWLEGNSNPPKELIDAYYDAKDDVGEHINVGRLHEKIVPHNSEFYEKINSDFKLDNTPDLF